MDGQFCQAILKSMLETTQDLVFIKDTQHRYLACSKSFLRLFGFEDEASIIGLDDEQLFGADSETAKRYIDGDNRVLALGTSMQCSSEEVTSTDGTVRYATTTKYPLRNDHDEIIGICGVSIDVTRQYKQCQKYERELSCLFELPHDAIFAALFDVSDWKMLDIRYKDDENCSFLNFDNIDTSIQHVVRSIVRGSEAREFFLGLSQQGILDMYASGRRSLDLEYMRHFRSIGDHWVKETLHLLEDPISEHVTALVILRDIDAQKRAEDELIHAARHDIMTGVLNRDATMKNITQYLADDGKDGLHALYLIDMDTLKRINDTFGHQMGDTALCKLASLIRRSFNEEDIVGRIGGDEFLILAKNAGSAIHVCEHAQLLAAKLHDYCTIGSFVMEFSASIGVSLSSGNSRNLDALYKEADVALYQAKMAGRQRYAMYQIEAE